MNSITCHDKGKHICVKSINGNDKILPGDWYNINLYIHEYPDTAKGTKEIYRAFYDIGSGFSIGEPMTADEFNAHFISKFEYRNRKIDNLLNI